MSDHQHASTSQTARILKMLKEAGSTGLTNGQLNRIAFRYGACIHTLRKEGHDILTIRENVSLYRFVYRGDNDKHEK